MSDLVLRRALPEDADAIAAFNLAMARETEAKALDPATLGRGVRALLADESKGFYLLAARDGRAVGQLMVTFEWSDWRNGVFWWIQSVYVTPASRRQGVYRALHQQVVAEARRAGGVCGLRLYVAKANRAAQSTYRALGLSPTCYDMYEIEL
jgi:ribosomal protein S18 acetylase RimI-like enzyme